jgi:3-deoxy-D-manno-octulosonic-acid transferase
VRSPLLWLYLAFSARALPLARLVLARRMRRGKEDPARLGERLGRPGVARPPGTLVWLHAASVGEALSILDLVGRLTAMRPDLSLLVTTGTTTSAELMAARLPEGAIHQYVPVDVLPAVRAFLAHWRPALAILIESELWPALISATAAAGVPLILINARFSDRSARGWRRAPGMARALIGRFAAILAQDETSAARLRALGAGTVTVTGSLKEGSAPLPHDEAERQRFARRLDGRPFWVAASTHAGEEGVVAEAHALIRRAAPRALLVLVPRHPARGGEIAAALTAAGWKVVRRAEGGVPGEATAIYLADTLGELGLWYRLAPVAFLGGSLVETGGHNPFEPAALGCAILHGPFVRNFADGFARLGRAGGARLVTDAASLAAEAGRLLAADASATMAAAAWDVVSAGAGVTDRVVALLGPHLPPASQ